MRDSHGRCVIHTAAACKQIYYFRLIQKYRGPSEPGLMDTQNEDGATPLMLACQQGNIEHVANLLSQKVHTVYHPPSAGSLDFPSCDT